MACDSDENEQLRRLVPSDVPIFFSQGDDALGRMAKALETYPAENAVRIRGDNVFIDPGLIDQLATAAEADADCDYASFCSHNSQPGSFSPVSFYAEWFRSSALRKANRLAVDRTDREDVTRYLYTHADKFRVRLLPAPAGIDRDDVRLTLHFEEDWDHALAIYEALGPERFDWQQIAELLHHQPALRSRMAALNRTHIKV
jgi:spore coat polysaccharide biosynthesis protein SpsF